MILWALSTSLSVNLYPCMSLEISRKLYFHAWKSVAYFSDDV